MRERAGPSIHCVDKFNAAFEALSACQIVGDCLIDIYICFSAKGSSICIWQIHNERHTEHRCGEAWSKRPAAILAWPFYKCSCWHFRFRFPSLSNENTKSNVDFCTDISMHFLQKEFNAGPTERDFPLYNTHYYYLKNIYGSLCK